MASEPSQLDRIEAKLDQLIAALADQHETEGETTPLLTLDGHTCGDERDQSQSLG